MRRGIIAVFVLGAAFITSSCDETLNYPYRPSERGKNILYSSFDEPPKHLDPAVSYSSDEYAFIGQIYEPPFQYHYLKRPYKLVPLTAKSVPLPQYLDGSGKPLPQNADSAQVAQAVYEIRIRKGAVRKIGGGPKDIDELFGIIEGWIFEDHRIDETEDGGIRSDAQCEGQDGGGGEARALSQAAPR